jgi:hypothetical protein
MHVFVDITCTQYNVVGGKKETKSAGKAPICTCVRFAEGEVCVCVCVCVCECNERDLTATCHTRCVSAAAFLCVAAQLHISQQSSRKLEGLACFSTSKLVIAKR